MTVRQDSSAAAGAQVDDLGPDWADERPPPGAWVRGSEALKRLLIGRPRPTRELGETLLPKFLALPIFSSDPISSVAYATEAALVVLIGTSATSGHVVFPLSIGIGVLLAIVAVSYTQVVRAYSSAGGAYVVARDNFGAVPSLVAGAALLVDYVLTVSVSVAGGMLAIVSAVPSISPWNVRLQILSVVVIALVNLRGVRESGLTFALPTYAFLFAMFALVGVGIGKCAVGGCPTATVPHPLEAGTGAIGLFVLLKAFASGSAALTGTESIANGVTAFRHPQASNAAKTLLLVAGTGIALFLGVSWLAVKMHARPSATVSVVSELAGAAFPHGSAHFMFWVIQVTTFAILILAANTSFQGFPRLAALMARDGYFPRQFQNLGDRLVYSNGIVVLSTVAIALIVVFSGNVISLLHLYVLGVFTAFTLSQAGMVVHWLRERDAGWRLSAIVNGVGAAATGIVGMIVIATKFAEGAWAVVVAIPLLVLTFLWIKRHYRVVARRLRAGATAVLAQSVRGKTVVLYVERLDQATQTALWYAKTIAPHGDLRAIHVPFSGSDPGIKPRFFRWAQGEPHLEILERQDDRVDAVLDYVWALPHGESDYVTVVIPELFRRPSLVAAFLHRTTFSLKVRLLAEPGLAITDVARVLGPGDSGSFVPTQARCVIPVSGVNAASLRAIKYAETLELPGTRALFFAHDEEDADDMRREWDRYRPGLPLEVVESPFRDLGGPLLARLRLITREPDTVAVVVMPELIVRGVDRLLHNQRALYLKRLLLFEPRVVLASVPYQLIH